MKNDFKLSNAIHPPLNPLPSREGRLNCPSRELLTKVPSTLVGEG